MAAPVGDEGTFAANGFSDTQFLPKLAKGLTCSRPEPDASYRFSPIHLPFEVLFGKSAPRKTLFH